MSKHLPIFIFFILFSCQKNTGPEALLGQFEPRMIQSDQGKEDLEVFLNEEALQKYQYAKKFEGVTLIKKIKFIYSNCINDSCSYTYDITYKVEKSGGVSFVDVRKQAVLKKIDELWKINDIEIIKSYIEYKKPIGI